MSFAQAAKQIAAQKMTTTSNGAVTHATTTSARVDLYFGVLRGTPESRVEQLVAAAYKEDALHTLKLVAHLRDIRFGKGEREVARFAFKWLASHAPDALGHNLSHYVAEYGRFDDVLALMGTPLEAAALQVLADQLRKDRTALDSQEPVVSLCAKWVPSENKSADKGTHRVNFKLAKHMGLTSADLRKQFLAPLRAKLQLLEQRMCANDWEAIDLNKVPSVAMHRHGKPHRAFDKHLADKFTTWKHGLKTGATKVNASVLHPHLVVAQYYGAYDELHTVENELVEAQWQVMLANGRAAGHLGRTLVMSDVSGSMSGTPMMVSIALGLLVSEVVEGEFHGLVMTFEEKPRFHEVVGTSLLEKVHCLAQAPWGGNTDFMAALRLILTTATNNNVAQNSMPEKLIVVSDMQFDEAGGAETNFQAVAHEFAAAGYTLPHMVFWNVNGDTTDAPTLANEANVSLLSGFSPAVLKAALTGQDQLTPLQTMINTVLDARYDLIQLPPSTPSVVTTQPNDKNAFEVVNSVDDDEFEMV
ncbi:hypothetical protein DYB30_006519 [Aphanomyces astaci]|uniref:VWFA domain-containing protein n=1 Tax=Aphanomyces astaci TaxID=112090 RepID=A0A397CYA5_APHAT|nr:hypothetical protein DYB30_006519 [Aphanomyces astaci]RHY55416.1 hypothetical protein DYB38_004073 [Aphanomyces astaci]